MEDNIYFTGSLPNLIETYIEQLNSFEDWDILFDSDFLRYIEGPIQDGWYVYPKTNEKTSQCGGSSRCAGCYLINNKCAKKLYENYIPFNCAPDWWMNHLFCKLNIKSFWVEPPIAYSRKHISTVAYDLENYKKSLK